MQRTRYAARPPPWLLRPPAELMCSVLGDGAWWTSVDPSQVICRGASELLEVAGTHRVSRLRRQNSYTLIVSSKGSRVGRLVLSVLLGSHMRS